MKSRQQRPKVRQRRVETRRWNFKKSAFADCGVEMGTGGKGWRGRCAGEVRENSTRWVDFR
jgi:hypothetical protein